MSKKKPKTIPEFKNSDDAKAWISRRHGGLHINWLKAIRVQTGQVFFWSREVEEEIYRASFGWFVAVSVLSAP